jgi:hypothetical protein
MIRQAGIYHRQKDGTNSGFEPFPCGAKIVLFDKTVKFSVVNFKQPGGSHFSTVCLLQGSDNKLFLKLLERKELFLLHCEDNIAG